MAKDKGALIFEGEDKEKLKTALKSNIHYLQLHPAYSYEDFIIGLQFEDGNTSYKKGYLLKILSEMKSEPDLPHVLILDEINRVDLSRLFGECFSALENRGEDIDLLGSNDGENIKLNIPDNLYIIGTMNLIDHSVEQLDFALRRRFLWFLANYNGDALLEICKVKWDALKWDGKGFSWDCVEKDFVRLVKSADKLNQVIRSENELGENFLLGHVFFLEAVPFLHQFLQTCSKRPSSFLFTTKGVNYYWRKPIEKLWKLSLNPLLEEYLSGLDNTAQTKIMNKLKEAFKP
jgi:5-methylcytosine-specific restriction protein B